MRNFAAGSREVERRDQRALRSVATAFLCVALAGCGGDDAPGGVGMRPIIDVHLHAFRTTPGVPEVSPGTAGLGVVSPATDDELRTQTLATLRANGVVRAMVSGTAGLVDRWVQDAPDLFIPGLQIGALPDGEPLDGLSSDSIRRRVASGATAVLGEMTHQYLGMTPTDSAVAAYFELAAELDVPVLVHTAGVGAPVPNFRAAVGSPLVLEPVLTRYPGLRVYVENAGYPFLDDMLAMLFQYPDRLYVDVSTIIRLVPEAEFYRYLRVLVEAGYGDRIMFGSDQVLWPETIRVSIEILERAPFLSEEQKDAIFFENAVRFFGLTELR